jgi:hypothetical protein
MNNQGNDPYLNDMFDNMNINACGGVGDYQSEPGFMGGGQPGATLNPFRQDEMGYGLSMNAYGGSAQWAGALPAYSPQAGGQGGRGSGATLSSFGDAPPAYSPQGRGQGWLDFDPTRNPFGNSPFAGQGWFDYDSSQNP